MDFETFLKVKLRRHFIGSMTKSTEIGTLHVENICQLEVPTLELHRYFVKIVELSKLFVAIRPIKSNENVAYKVLRFLNYFEKQLGCIVKKINADGATEIRRAFDYLKREGVKVSHTNV